MAFRIDDSFNPGAILGSLKLADPTEAALKQQQLQNARNEASLFPLKQKLTEQAVKEGDFTLQEKQRQLEELKAYQQVMGKYQGDYEKARPELAQVMRPKALADIDNVYLNRAEKLTTIGKNRTETQKALQDIEDKIREEYGDLAEQTVASENPYATMDAGLTLMERTHPDRAQQFEAVRQQLQQNPDEALRLAEGLRTQKSRAATQELRSKKSQQDADEANTALRKAETPGAQAKSDIEVQQANALKTMTDADWQKAIDQTVEDKSTPLYRRTMAEVKFYRDKGDLKGASDAIKRAGDQLGRTETAVATAKATVPYKIEVAAAGAQARSQATQDAMGLTEDDYKRAGEQYGRTGMMPALGRDSVTRGKIEHYKNEWARDNGFSAQDLVMMQAAYKGDVESLKKFQAQRDQIVSFEQTAQKNLDLFLSQAQKIVDSGSPWINRPLRALGAGMGSEELAAVNAARQIANNEIAKVTSGGGLGGVLSDSARHEVSEYNPKEATFKQTVAVAKILKQDMANRHQSMDATLSDIKTRIGGGQQGGGTKYSRTATGPNGHKIGTNDGMTWFDVQTGQRIQ